jgi:hypothetical protein
LTLAGEVAASMAPDDDAFFNDTGYEQNPLRRVSFTLSASLALGRPLALLAEARTENLESLRLYALYLRYRPWADRPIDAQLGLVPPVFGAFGRRPYGSGNPLIGFPLAYQYLTTLRADATPASADELLQARGFGWRVRYQVGDPYPGPGLPIMDAQRWDTGAQLRLGREPVQLAVAVTQGSLARPRFRDDNRGKQLAARLQATPVTGLVLALSAARAERLDRALVSVLPAPEAARTRRQRALGFDLEYARGHAILRAEGVFSSFDLPALDAPRLEDPVAARAVSVEGIYRPMPGLDLAARFDRLAFGDVLGSTARASWDANVTRIEAGAAYALRRGVLLKATYQRNWRAAGPRGRRGLPAVQVIWRF